MAADEHTRRTKAIEAFIKPDEPGTSRSFGPGVTTSPSALANPAFINSRKGATGDGKQLVCSNQPLQRQPQRGGHERTHEPHARSARLQQREL